MAQHSSHRQSLFQLDRWIVGVSVILFMGAVVLLTDSRFLFRLGPPVSNVEVIAQVTRTQNDVRRRSEKELGWLDLRSHEDLFLGDSVYTGDQSDAHLLFSNGSEFSLDPNSLVKLTSEYGQMHLDLQLGGGSGVLGKGVTLSVTHEKWVRQIRGDQAHFRLVQKEKGNLQVTLLSGHLEVSTEKTKKVLETNQEIQITPDEKIEVIEPFLLSLVSPFDGAAVRRTENDPIHFRWIGLKEVPNYQLEISNTEDFTHPIRIETPLNDSIDVKQIPDRGIFYWRVFVPGATLHSMLAQSPTFKFTVIPGMAPLPIGPEVDQQFKIENRSEIPIQLKWKDFSGANRYEVQVASDLHFSQIVFSEEVTDSKVLTPHLKEGHYFWRVRSFNDEKPNDYSQPTHFEILKKSPLPAPEIPKSDSDFEMHSKVSPKAHGFDDFLDFFIPAARAQEAKTGPLLRWAPIPGAFLYHLEISDTSEFKKVLFKAEPSQTVYHWIAPGPGNYFWRVAAVDRDGDVGQWSQVVPLRISVAPAVPLGPKEWIEKFSSEEELTKKSSEINLSWSPVTHAQYYRIQIGRDRTFQKGISFETRKTELKVPVLETGNFYWKVQALNSLHQSIGRESFVMTTRYDRVLEPRSTIPISRKYIGFRTLIGVNSRSYSETQNPEFTETSLEARLRYQSALPWNEFRWEATSHFTLFSIAATQNTPGKHIMRLFAGGVNLGHALPWFPVTWEGVLYLGAEYQTTSVTDNAFGFHNLLGPQLKFQLDHSLSSDDRLAGSLRFLYSKQEGQFNQELGFGFEWTHVRPESWPLVVSLDYSKIKVNFSNVLFIQTSAWTLSSGTNW